MNTLIKEKNLQNEQLIYLNKQIKSLEDVKNELNSQIALLNDELNKSKTLSTKLVNMEQEKRVLMEEMSGMYIQFIRRFGLDFS